MTRNEALAALIAKVEAGEAVQDMDGWFHLPLTVREDKIMISHMSKAWSAYEGSLDAAKALHEAVLPRQGWEIFKTGEYPGMIPGSSRFSFGARVGYGTTYRGDDDCAARAWLLAILRALHAQEADA